MDGWVGEGVNGGGEGPFTDNRFEEAERQNEMDERRNASRFPLVPSQRLAAVFFFYRCVQQFEKLLIFWREEPVRVTPGAQINH